MKIAGIDLGKTTISVAIIHLPGDGPARLEHTASVTHGGEPGRRFERLYDELSLHRCAALGATGAYSEQLGPPVVALPEDACLTATLDWLAETPASLNLISAGAGGYRALSRRAGSQGQAARVQYMENDKCSSGTGENISRIAGRFGLSLEQADALALEADGSVPITARCSVFAKSEMTHHANEGAPAADLFAGYFSSVALNAHALLARVRVDGPIWAIGGVARSRAFLAALSQMAGQEVTCPELFLGFEAVGAALLCAEAPDARDEPAPLPAEAGSLVRPRARRFEVLEPASVHRHRVTVMPDPEPQERWPEVPTVLGLDLGSTGAKAALTSVRTGERLMDVYDQTRGDPVQAARRLVEQILSRADGGGDMRAVAVTGSGRQAVATVLRACFDEADHGRVVVQNEIVAHAAAAVRCDPDAGADLSVVEIGGQDAKYIRISGGRVVESDMNKACSAGTGSFLAEQAAFYDVDDIDRMVQLASDAQRPPDLGQMCTVYVADAAALALKEGFELGDLLAGFQYSVIHNYLHRVMGQRTLAQRVFFQGKPAQNDSLAWTLAAISGREIMVPPNPGAMGAWGVGLCAVEQLGPEALLDAAPLDPAQLLQARVEGRSEFICADKGCATSCPIVRTEVRVGDARRTTLSGGECPKFEESTADQPKLDRDAPDPFVERAALIDAYEAHRPGAPDLAIPQVGALAGHIPFLATLAARLGASVRLLRPNRGSLAAGEQLCNSFDSCGPVKVTLAVCDTDARWLLLPKITHVSDLRGEGGHTCVTEQAMPEMVQQALDAAGRHATVLGPVLSFEHGLEGEGALRAARHIAQRLGADPSAVKDAVRDAAWAQRRYERDLLHLGSRALRHARQQRSTAVLVCGSLHVMHDPVLSANIPRLLRQNGAVAVPADCYPTEEQTEALPKIYFGDANRSLRAALCARRRGDAYPLMIASFGCGPASFTEQIFQSLLEGHPHTVLEADGHGGGAGFVTRIQAFLQSARQHEARRAAAAPAADSPRSLRFLQRGKHRGPYLDRDVRYLFMSSVDNLGPVFAAAYRSAGYDAAAAPPLSEATVARGRGDCSGKECLSYQLIWGAFRKYLEDNPTERETRLVQISGQQCRAGMFPIKDQLNLDRMALAGEVTVTALRIAGGPAMSASVWAGMVAVDILRQLYLYHLAVEPHPGAAAEIYRLHGDRVIELLEQPLPRGSVGLGLAATMGRRWRQFQQLLADASGAFASMEQGYDGQRLPVVFLSGDQMTKGNNFAAGGALEALAARGVRIMFEPTCDFLEYLAEVHPSMVFGRGSDPVTTAGLRLSMVTIRDTLYARVRGEHPWLPTPDVVGALARSGELLERTTNGGSAYAVGSVLQAWDTGRYDGVLMTACWGCDNGLVAESLLRRRKDIPVHFFYDDGTPIDERRLASLAFSLRRSVAASGLPSGAAPAPWHRRARDRARRMFETVGIR